MHLLYPFVMVKGDNGSPVAHLAVVLSPANKP